MTVIQGGIRYRLIRDSLFNMLEDTLDQLGWWDDVDSHLPLTFAPEEADYTHEIAFNTVALADLDRYATGSELGSSFTENSWTFYLDFFAESKDLGIEFISDVEAIVKGKLALVNRNAPILPVYDYRLATPDVVFTCQIEKVVVDKGDSANRPWLRNWYTCRFDVIDYM